MSEVKPEKEKKEKEKKPNKSNLELQNEVNMWKEEAGYSQGIAAQLYDELDSIQNIIGTIKQKAKRQLQQSPMNRVVVNNQTNTQEQQANAPVAKPAEPVKPETQ